MEQSKWNDRTPAVLPFHAELAWPTIDLILVLADSNGATTTRAGFTVTRNALRVAVRGHLCHNRRTRTNAYPPSRVLPRAGVHRTRRTVIGMAERRDQCDLSTGYRYETTAANGHAAEVGSVSGDGSQNARCSPYHAAASNSCYNFARGNEWNQPYKIS